MIIIRDRRLVNSGPQDNEMTGTDFKHDQLNGVHTC